MRFDMRATEASGPVADLYAAAVEMAAWGDRNGCMSIQVSEHHASPDGYLPTPLLLACAMAARTERVPFQVAASLLPLHDPVSLAEQMCVVDILSRGRTSFVCAIGYRPAEYEMFGRDYKKRGERMEQCLTVITRAFQGEPFEIDGRRVHVTPGPYTPGGPPLLMGGSHPAAVRRAARFGMGMLTQGGDASLDELYHDACKEYGTTPGLFINAPLEGGVMSGFVAEDPDRAWAELGPHMLHDAQMYAAWMGGDAAASKSVAGSVAELRAENGPYRIFTPDEAVAHIRATGVLMTQPLSGGIPPELAWPSLELIASKVLPALQTD